MSGDTDGVVRRCCTCKTNKPLEDFYRRTSCPLGREYQCKKCHNEAKNARRNTPEGKQRLREQYAKLVARGYKKSQCDRHRMRTYGVDVETYQRMLDAQNHVCAICKQQSPDGRALAIDHDHRTNAIRGLLCCNCNNGLGRFKDSVEYLETAIKYLTAQEEERNSIR